MTGHDRTGARVVLVLLVAGQLLTGSETGSAVDRFGESGQQGNKGPNTPAPIEQTSQARFNFFDGELLQEVSRQVQGNFVISPASIKTLLGIILEAAEGPTLREIKEILRLPNDPVQARQLMTSLQAVLQKVNSSLVEVDSETSFFHSKDLSFNTTYTKAIADWYKAGVMNVDFKSPENAANRINSWVSSQTRGRIPSLIEPQTINPETQTMLVNTVYFDGRWKEEFLLKDTKEECFFSEPTLDCSMVPVMYKKERMNYKFYKDFNSHVVHMPYKDERFSMVLVVPVTVDGLRRIVRDINRLTFPALLDRASAAEVHLELPRFSVEYQADLRPTLTKMGLNDLFTDEAQLPYLVNNKQGRVSAVVHSAKIDVSERGTKAAAASGASIVPLMSGNDEVIVRADRPFFYFVYETESRSVLFSGRVSSLGGAGNQENAPGESGLAPLSVSQPARPSPGHMGPPGQSQNSPSRQPNPPSPGVQYQGSDNQHYNIRVPPSPPQSYPSTSNPDSIQYPLDHGTEATGAEYLNKYKKRHETVRPQQRSFVH